MARKDSDSDWPDVTRVEWRLVVGMFIGFPTFAYALVRSLGSPPERAVEAGLIIGGGAAALLSFAMVAGRRHYGWLRRKARRSGLAQGQWVEWGDRFFGADLRTSFDDGTSAELVVAGVRDGALAIAGVTQEEDGQREVRVRISTEGEAGLKQLQARTARPPERPQARNLPPLGDDVFDREVRLAGNAAAAVAVLDHATRAKVLAALGGSHATIAFDGEAPVIFLRDKHVCTDEEPFPRPTVPLEHTIERCCRILPKLRSGHAEALPRLARNAQSDPSPWVRCRNLEVLIEHYREDPAVPPAVAAAAQDKHQAVRAIASSFAGGPTAFRELSEVLARENYPEHLRAHALAYLARAFPLAQVRSLLEAGLVSSSKRVARAALKAAATSGDASLVGKVCSRIKQGKVDNCEQVIHWVASSKAECVEPALVDLLAVEQGEIVVAAIAGLGAIGTERAIDPLLDPLRGGRYASAAQPAITQIRARSMDVAAGRLSLAAGEARAGTLSLAAEAGTIELAPDHGKGGS